MKVDEQADGNIEQFHIAEQLGLMDGKHLFDGLKFQTNSLRRFVASSGFPFLRFLRFLL